MFYAEIDCAIASLLHGKALGKVLLRLSLSASINHTFVVCLTFWPVFGNGNADEHPCRALIRPLILIIDGSNLDRAINGLDLYTFKFNLNSSCRDKRSDQPLQPALQGCSVASPVPCFSVWWAVEPSNENKYLAAIYLGIVSQRISECNCFCFLNLAVGFVLV